MKGRGRKTRNAIGNRRAEWIRRAIALCMSILVLCSGINLEVLAKPVQGMFVKDKTINTKLGTSSDNAIIKIEFACGNVDWYNGYGGYGDNYQYMAALTSGGDLYLVYIGSRPSDMRVDKVLDNIIDFSFYGENLAALKENGDLYVAGHFASSYGGAGAYGKSYYIFVKVMSDVKSFSFAGAGAAAVTTNGDLYVWGSNSHGQIGNGTTNNSSVPIYIMSNISVVKKDYYHTVAITEDGKIYLWGKNYKGIWASEEYSSVPKRILYGIDADNPVSCVENMVYTNFIELDNVLDCQINGRDFFILTKTGQLYGSIGDEDLYWMDTWYDSERDEWADEMYPAFVLYAEDVMATFGSLSRSYTAYGYGGILKTNGNLHMWNFLWNHSPQLGISETILANVKCASADGHNNLAAVTNTGVLYFWEGGSDGTISETPIMVRKNVSDVKIGNSGSTTIGTLITSEGKLYIWGSNIAPIESPLWIDIINQQFVEEVSTEPDSCVYKISDGETIIQITDPKGHAIKNATVKSISTNQEQKTTDTGLAKFTNLSGETETFNVTAAGYPSQTESFDLEKCGHFCKVVMAKDGLSKATLIYNGNKYNLLVEEKKINEADKNTKFQIQCEAVENTKESIEKYTIEQEKKQGVYNKIAESEEGSFSLQTNKFQAGEQVYACGYDENNKELFRIQINLKIMKAIKETEVTKINLGKDVSFTVGDNVPFFGGKKITLKGLTALPVYTEIDDETIKVGFNVNVGELGTDDKTKKWKWQGMKETLQKSLLGRGDTVFDDIKKYSDKGYVLSKKPGISIAVAGYAEGPVTGEKVTGKLYISLDVSWGIEGQLGLTPVAVAFDLDGIVSGGGESTFQITTSDFEGKVFAEGSIEGKGSVGLGLAEFISAGVYGKASTSAKYILLPKEVTGLEYWKMNGELGLQFRALGKERGSLKIMDGEHYFYKRDSSTKRAAAGLQENDSKNLIAALTDQYSYTTIPHEQLAFMEENVAVSAKEVTVSENSISENSVSGNALEAANGFEYEATDGVASIMFYAGDSILADDWSGDIAVDKADVDSVFVQTSSYIDSMPQLVSCGEDVVMLYLDDYPVRSAQNASTLMYSLYNGQDNTWSVPRPVYDDGTADYNPTVCKKENGFYVMWNNGKTAVPDGEELSLADTAEATDLYRMSYDMASHAFTDGKTVTENGQAKANGAVVNGIYEKAAVMAEKNGKNYYAWIENSVGNVFGMEGINHIIFAEDTENMAQAVPIADVNKPVFDLKLGTVNDRLYLAYTYDKDGDVSDISDTGLVICDVTGGKGAEQAIYEGSVANIQFDAYNGEKALLWYADGNYFMWNGEQVSALFEEEKISGSSFQYFTGADGKQYISYIGSDEAGLNGYLLQYDTDNTAWGQPVQITETENYIEQLNSIAWNGKVLSVYNLVKANMEQENDWIQSCSLGSVLTGAYCDLSIRSADYVSGDFQKNVEFPVTMLINNGGTKTVESVKVSLLNSSKQLVTETDVDVKLLPGSSQEVECSLALPSALENDIYYFAVEKNQINCPERNESDNSHEVRLGMTDIQTTAHLNRVNGYYSIVASMINKGLETGAARLIIKNYKTGEEYYSEDIESLEPGANYHLEIPLQSLEIPEDEESAICIQAVSENEQEVEGNNEAYVNIVPYTTEDDTKQPEPVPDKEEEKTPDSQGEKDSITQHKIPVNKITISGISKKIAAGKKIQLTATVLPQNASDKNVIWHSSNKKYATVSSKGKVSVKKAGIGRTVTITATARDGSNVKTTYKIKIMKNVVKKITIQSSKKTVKAGKNLKLKAIVKTNGKSANTKVTWTSSNTKYATVNSKGVVKAKKAGKGRIVKITAKATDGSGKKGTIKIKIR